MYEFKLPDVGEGIHEAEILKWLVNVGDVVSLNQPLLEIQTDKAVVEIPAPVEGTIADIRAEEGSIAEVGDIIITIAPKNNQSKAAPIPARPQSAPASSNEKSNEKSAAITGPKRRVLAAPVVRKLALELDIDLNDVSGSGPAGRILPGDVHHFVEQKERAAAQAPSAQVEPEPVAAEAEAAPPPAVVPPQGPAEAAEEISDEENLQGLRRIIAERMEQAWHIPHVTSFEEIEVTNLVALRKQLKPEAEGRHIRLTYLPFIIKAVVQTLKEHPYFNASLDFDQKKIFRHRYYHIGIATAVPEGLLVPVIRHADRMNLLQLASELARLGELAPARKLGPMELSGSTFTITNFGSYGGYQGTPIINAPEVAILGCGRIEARPAAVDGRVELRPTLPLALSYDHRLIDGAAAGRFLTRLKALLADPNLLFLELI